MFGSGEVNIPSPDMKMMGMDDERLSTAEQARVLPVPYGTARMGVTFISKPWNVRADERTQSVSKGEDIVTGYDYFCSFCALVCQGPVSIIHAIYFDDEKVYPIAGTILSKMPNEDYADITMANGCSWRIYWGTETQQLDSDLDARLLKDNDGDVKWTDDQNETHSAYKGQCYIVAKSHYLGYQRTSVQTIELVVTRLPQVSGISQGIIRISDMLDCSVPLIIADALTNRRYGLGLSSDYIDFTSFNAVGARLYIESLGLSPVLNRAQSFGDFLLELLAYVDAFFYTTPEGKIALGIFRGVPCSQNSDAGGPDYPLITEDALSERPEITVNGITTTRNEIRVKFVNCLLDFKDDCCMGQSAGVLRMTGQPSSDTLQREWVTKIAIADKMARIAAKLLSVPKVEGRLKVRKSKMVWRGQGREIKLGDPFYLSYNHYGLCWEHCVVVGITQEDPTSPEITIDFEGDRGYLNNETYDATAGYIPPGAVDTSLPLLEHSTALERPAGWDKSEPDDHPEILVLASKLAPMMTQAIATYDAGDADYRRFLSGVRFAAYGQFSAFLYASETSATFVGEPYYQPVLPQSIDTPANLRPDWIIIFEHNDPLDPSRVSAGSDEIIGINSASRQQDGTWLLTLSRGLYDTIPADVPSGAKMFIQRRYDIKRSPLSKKFVDGAEIDVKVQGFGGYAFSPIPDNPIPVSYHRRPSRPITPKALNGPASWNETAAGLAFTWPLPFTAKPGLSGPTRILDIRPKSAEFSYEGENGGFRAVDIPGDVTGITVSMTGLLHVILSPYGDLTARMWSVENGLESRNYSQLEIPYV